MALEHYHMVLKHHYLDSREGRRLDNLIHKLVIKSKDDIKRRFIKIQSNSYSFRDKEVRPAHAKGLLISDNDIIDCGSGGWLVKSQSMDRFYMVELLSSCKEVRCLTCRDCKVCRHMVKCECLDYTSNDNICKHIHACISRNPNVVAPRRVDTEKELAEMVKYFRTEAPDYKRKLAAKVDSIVLAIQDCTDDDRRERICAAFESAGSAQGRGAPANKFATPQRRVGATKRRRIDFSVNDGEV